MSQKSILRKPNDQSNIVNFAARASAKRNVRFVINEKDEEETKHAIPERESKYSESESESNMESEHSYSDWDENYNNNENKNEENEMEVDDDPSSDYVPSEEDISSDLEDVSTSEDEDKMEMDDDPLSDYVPSDDDDDDDEPEDFDEKVVNILSSLKYDTLTPSEYLFDWGSEYWYKLESTKAITRENLTSFKRKIQSSRQWNNLVSKVKMMVEKERLE